MNKHLKLILLGLTVLPFCSCSFMDNHFNKSLSDNDRITLTVAYYGHDYHSLEMIADKFENLHKNVSVHIFSLEGDYTSGLIYRMENDLPLDIFMSNGISNNNNAELIDYTVDLYSRNDFRQDLVYMPITDTYSDNGALYSLPFIVNFSGMFINETVHEKYNVAIPTNFNEFMASCEAFYQQGVSPITSNLTRFSSNFIMPYSNNIVANDNELKDDLENKTNIDSIVEKYDQPLNVLETIVKNKYFDYSVLENRKYSSDNIQVFKTEYIADPTTFAGAFMGYLFTSKYQYEKDDNLICPYMFGYANEDIILRNLIKELDPDFKYRFIPSLATNNQHNPVTLFAENGLAVSNRTSELNQAWSIEFLNFLSYHSKEFANKKHVLPNSNDLISYILNNFPSVDETSIAISNDIDLHDHDYKNIFSNFFLLLSKDSAPKFTELEIIDQFDYTDEELINHNTSIYKDANGKVASITYNGRILSNGMTYSNDQYYNDGYSFYKAFADDDGVSKTFVVRIDLLTNKVYVLKSSLKEWSHEHYQRKLKACIQDAPRFCYNEKTTSENAAGWLYFDIEDVINEKK